MKTLYTFGLMLLTGATMAQVPTNFGSNAEDGIIYQTYNLIDHGTVSSVRFQAQNAIAAGDGTWEFYTGDYMNNWRPYALDDTLSSFDMIIDPSAETASARYNSGYGGQTGKLQAIQAGYFYTAIIGNNVTADNFMSIIETDFAPVVIDTVYNTPTNPTETDDIVITVELDGALSLSAGEHLYIRGSVNEFTSSTFYEVTNFSNGVGTITIPAGIIFVGWTFNYYALVTEQANPLGNGNMDYFTLFFGNNSGANYEFTVSPVTGVEDPVAEFGITNTNGTIRISNSAQLNRVELIAVDGKIVSAKSVNGSAVNISTNGLAKGVYVLNLIGADHKTSTKLFVD